LQQFINNFLTDGILKDSYIDEINFYSKRELINQIVYLTK